MQDSAPGASRQPDGGVIVPALLRSRLLARDVGLRIYTPAGMPGDDARYPVLYVHDGQNVFAASHASFSGHAWALDLTLDRLIRARLVAPPIVVAIDHAGEGRIDEFTPTRHRTRPNGGAAARYARFLVEELKPFIDHHFPIEPWTSSTAMAGSSMGGLVTLVAGFQYPGTFGALGVVSPSVWWDNRVILRSVRARVMSPRPRIWLDVGLLEPSRAVDDTRMLRKVLVREGWGEPRSLRYGEDPEGDHSEVSWARRAEPMLRFLLPPRARGTGRRRVATTRAAGGPGPR